MRRSLPARAGVALVAFSFLLTVSGPGALHQCPAHSMGTMAGQDATHHHGAQHHAPPRDGKPPHCTCAGLCCWGGAVAALPGAPPQLARIVPTDTPQLYRLRGPAASAPRLLPFATGPPRTP